MELEGSVPYYQEPTAGPYPEQVHQAHIFP